MAKVKKLNRVLTVSDNAVGSYLEQGYDQVDDNGKVLKRATGGRTVTLAEHNKVVEELEKLKEQQGKSEAFEELKKENTSLKGKVTKLEKKVEELEKAAEPKEGPKEDK